MGVSETANLIASIFHYRLDLFHRIDSPTVKDEDDVATQAVLPGEATH
jgi:hypothetical protein